MILNVFSDDLKFVDLGIDLYERTSFEYKYIILTTNKNLDISVLMTKNLVKPILVNSEAYIELLANTNKENFSGIIFNSLIRKPLKIFLYDCLKQKNKKLPKIAWSLFGAELYENIDYVSNYLGSFSKKIYYKQNFLRRLILFKRLLNLKLSTKRLLNQVDYMMVYMQQEIKYFKKISKINLPNLWLTYYPIENLIGESLLNDTVKNNSNILVGNSGTITNNHIEVFEIIKKFDIDNRKIIVPLSYGDTKYVDEIIKKGKKYFGENFLPLTKFMPREEYNKIILSCSFVFMNHYRQQAMGNILTALWLGSEVYLNSFTTSYKYFSDIGININSIQDLQKYKKSISFERTDDMQIEKNQLILMKELGLDVSIEKINNSLRILTNN